MIASDVDQDRGTTLSANLHHVITNIYYAATVVVAPPLHVLLHVVPCTDEFVLFRGLLWLQSSSQTCVKQAAQTSLGGCIVYGA